jgi:UDP-N-acetylglucosamine--N-acetylmuramyl-(pentapeptide) pyrophosphoryl-undecaprenol N-acetylglucosamine transferase
MGIPTVIQEQNSYPGITTRILASKVDCVFVAYKESLRYLKNVKRYVHVGNPISDKIGTGDKEEAQKYFGLQKNKTTVLIFGGSQGSKRINAAVDTMIQTGTANKVQIIWQTGNSFFNLYKEKYKNSKNSDLHILPFIDRMDLAYCISDFAICRAGAMTISELAAAGLPAILIPYPYATAAHQLRNAKTIVQGGGALLVEENDNLEDSLKTAMMRLISSPEVRDNMSEKIAAFHRVNTTEIIMNEIKKILNKTNNP